MRAATAPLLALLLALLVLAFAALSEPSSAASSGGYRVIVHPSNPITEVRRSFLEDAFLKKVSRWPNDVPLRPVDLAPALRAREPFSEQVLERSITAVRAYWRQRIFSGRGVPPPELASEEQAVEYVLGREGAVAYISTETELRGSKVLVVRD